MSLISKFLENDFWPPRPSSSPPPPINFVHESHKYHIDIIGDVAAAPGPVACPSALGPDRLGGIT